MGKRTTIEDVAKFASIGKTTVSYVLNGRAGEVGISKETTRRILDAARELDYRPNGVARMLARKRSDAIAVVFQHAHYFSLASTFLNDALRGVCEECVAQNVDLLLHTRPVERKSEEADQLSDGRVDGVLLLRDSDDPTLTALIKRSFPVVLFFSRSQDIAVPFVDCDNFTGGKIAANHLLSLGHQRFGMVIGSINSVDSADRFQGYRSTIEANGFQLPRESVITVDSPTAPLDHVLDLLHSPNRPTALFVWSDDVAISLIRAIQNDGIRIPEDLSIVGFDSTSACEAVNPPLTSVRQPVVEMARAATRILCGLTRESEPTSRQLIFPPQLDVRGSTTSPKIP